MAQTDDDPAVGAFKEQHGQAPPWFLVIGPGHGCNLKCSGCYASSGADAAKLEWSLLDRLMSEAKERWGIRLFVISGGEPLLYRSEGRDLLDCIEKHSDCLFLVFTNGTLIDRAMADRMARLGNLTPALSVEGFREETDQRRGIGTFDRVIGAMAHLREVGVPFGVSLTATRSNCERILSDQMVDFLFYQQGALYGFIFPYSPVGADSCMDWVPTAEQSIAFLRRAWQVVESRRIFLLDFWNHGPLVEGCIAAGRDRGYLYIDWNANVMPCVFFPYVAANIRNVYAQGGDLDSVWSTPFLQALRSWQQERGFAGCPPSAESDWLSPCPFRDHYAAAYRMVQVSNALPEDEAAARALADDAYRAQMIARGVESRRLRSKIWRDEYVLSQTSKARR
jgi:MoaA/NifB/PqqE/SkfB family radical SAM enzyme